MREKFFYLCLAVIIIAFITLFSLSYWRGHYLLFLEYYDIAYHASSATGFQRAGGFTLTNFWAGNSIKGSPYIYFPFFHIVELLLLSLRANASFLTYWLSWLLFPLSLITILLFTSKTYGIKTALYTVFLLSLSPLWMEKQWGLPPQAFVFVVTPLIFLALVKERYIIVIVLTLFCMGTHFTGLFLFPFLLLYGLQNKSQRKAIFIILGILLLVSSPFIWFSLRRVSSQVLLIKLHKSTLINSIMDSFYRLFGMRRQFHVYMGWLAIAGLIICYLKRNKYLILPTYFFVFFPIAWTTQLIRFWGAPALLIFSLLGGVALGTFHNWIERGKRSNTKGLVFLFITLFIGCFLFSYISKLSPQFKTPSIIYLRSPHLWLDPKILFSMEERQKIIDLVESFVDPDEFFWINSSYNLNNFVAANTTRSTVLSPKIGVMPEGMRLVVDKQRPSSDYILLDEVNQQFNAYILTKPDRAAKVLKPKPLIRTKCLVVILSFFCLLIVIDLFGLSKRLFILKGW